MPLVVPANGFAQQVEEFGKQLLYLSDHVEVADDQGNLVRATSYLVELPAADGTIATFDYREEFTRTRVGWRRRRYAFELRLTEPTSRSLHSRRAHHLHEPWAIHQHCKTAASADEHYADVERLLQATHELFLKQWLSGAPIDCAGLIPLVTVEEGPRSRSNG
ncbi:MAG TPA: hypothetical protein VFB69_01695 [Candidatus Dormibacteraeota bacterium]|nr:hypothetical protein [Candidatus Dormibacteraeota bacterium]